MVNPIGFWTLLKRESLRFLSLPNQTILPSIMNTALFIVVFGFFLGTRVKPISGVSYIVFIFPGLLMMGVVTATFQNSCMSLFISRWERFVEDLLVAPISFGEMVTALIAASVLRGFITGVTIMIVGLLLIPTPFEHPLLLVPALIMTSIAFAGFGLIVGLWAERWDNIAIWQNYVITPLVFLGGVFYSTATLPEGWRFVNAINPIFYMVSAVRYAFLGRADISYARAMMVTSAMAILFSAFAVHLFRIGYKLRT